ncbi:MAG: GNAT family N-acetyltransferase [Gemmataceae bacterium]
MTIRTFQAGDDVAQVSIYNEAGAALPHFKPATVDDVRRRCRAPDFDPGTRFYAAPNGRPVGYVMFQPNGRVGFPWCRKGHEALAEPLLERALDAMRQRGLTRAFTAHRADWPAQHEFFLARGFRPKREMVNYVLDLVEMPTPAARPSSNIGPLRPADLPALLRSRRASCG